MCAIMNLVKLQLICILEMWCDVDSHWFCFSNEISYVQMFSCTYMLLAALIKGGGEGGGREIPYSWSYKAFIW